MDGGVVAANLRRPPALGAAAVPLVILIPGLDSTKEEFFLWESVFLERGMATLSLDGPGQGETGFRMDIRPDYEVAVARRWTRLPGGRGSTATGSAPWESASAGTTSFAPPPSSRASGRWPGSAGRLTSPPIGTRCRS